MNKPALTNIDDVIKEIIVFDLPIIIGIDGFMLSGKTTLANSIASKINTKVIHLDDYIRKENKLKPYDSYIKYNDLRADINGFSKSSHLIIEGICLQTILSKIGILPQLLIYTKRLACNGIWHDGLNLEDYQTNSDLETNSLTRDAMKYHLEKYPHKTANLIFQRVES